MNIFAVEKCPTLAARALCDAHVIKMALESTQLLCTSLRLLLGDKSKAVEGLYKATHINHPCTRWVTANTGAWCWTYLHGIALIAEYKRRYLQTHACGDVLKGLYIRRGLEDIDQVQLLARRAPPLGANTWDETIAHYRAYYKIKQRTLTRFTYRCNPPSWLFE